MDKMEIGNLLDSGAAEIQQLRVNNMNMGEKLEIFYGMLRLSQLVEKRDSQGQSPDVAWEMRVKAQELKKQFDLENQKSAIRPNKGE